MYIVGLYVAIDPDSFDLMVPEIKSMPSIEIKSLDPITGRLLINVAGSDEHQQKDIFEKIRALPFVMEAEIIYFYHYEESDYAANRPNDHHSARQLYKSYNAIVHTQH